MKPKIEHPKVFVSYAWANKEYEKRVLSLSSDLQRDGVEVIIDKWNLKEGNDTYAFMEKSVNDDTVTNVLILLDPVYEEKANNRVGGVGTETQIISPEIYNKVTQEKFIPVVMERGNENSVPKPQYLKSLYHIDLSESERFNDEYQKLVRRLYGVETYPKPELGQMPSWVTDVSPISSQQMSTISKLKKNNNPKSARIEFISLLNDLKSRIVSFDGDTDSLLEVYNKMLPLRNEYIQYIEMSHLIENSDFLIGDFLQELYNEINLSPIFNINEKLSFLHEIFIYTLIIKFKEKDFDSLAYFFNRTFFEKDNYSPYSKKGFSVFYNYNVALDEAKKKADNKKYYSGVAELWIENIYSDVCNKKEMVFIDTLLHNYCVFGKHFDEAFKWFPITYIYDGEYDNMFTAIIRQLISKEKAQIWIKVFGYSSIDEFSEKMKTVLENKIEPVRYNMSFYSAPLISDIINPEQIATLN